MSETFPVLVTGGAGYIGSHVCKALAAAGHLPVAYDNLVYGHPWAVRWGPLEVGDIADRQRLDAVFKTYKPRAVLHFAGFAYVGESVQQPGKYYRNNVAGSISLLEAMRDHRVGRLIFSSSCATYGNALTVPIPESHPQHPVNPYGASKLMVERIIQDFGVTHGIRSVSLRYFNAAGADADGELGEDHDPETHIIPLMLQAALGLRDRFTVFGDDYDTADGTCIRDYIHVTDLAAAHLLALDSLSEADGATAFNLGTNEGLSVRQLVDLAERVTGKRIPLRIESRRPGDVPHLVGDASVARKVLGWKPRFSDPETILESAWRWHTRERSR